MKKRFLLRLYMALFFGLLPSLAWGAPSVEVRLERPRTTLDAPVHLVLHITGGSGEMPQVEPENSREVRLIPRGQSTSVQIVNGSQSVNQELYYAVIPQKEGTLEVPSLRVRFSSGEEARTKPLSLEVAPGSTPSSAPGEKSAPPREGNSPRAFVTASLSKEKAYTGEPVTYRFSFFQALPTGESRLVPPDFAGIPWEVREKEEYRTEIDGTSYVVTEIPFVLSPLEPGTREISPGALEVVLLDQQPRHSDPFGSMGFPSSLEELLRMHQGPRGTLRRLETQPLSLEVLPLPPLSGDLRFSGLVGSADMRCMVRPQKGTTGEPLSLKLLVRGKGNLRDLDAPELSLPPAFKLYEEPGEESLLPTAGGYEGIKAFSWSLVPLQPGSWDLPPARLTVFDPEEGNYVTLERPFPPLAITGAPLSEARISPSPEPSPEGPSEAPSKQQSGEDSARKAPKFLNAAPRILGDIPAPSGRLFAGIALGPPVLLVLLLLLREWHRRGHTIRGRMRGASKKALRRARKTRDASQKLQELQKALHKALLCRQNREGELFTREEIRAMAPETLSPEEAREAESLLEELNKSLYGRPNTPEASQKKSSLEQQVRSLARRLWTCSK